MIQKLNRGAFIGPDYWIDDPTGKPLISNNPTISEPIAKVIQTTPDAYEKEIITAQS